MHALTSVKAFQPCWVAKALVWAEKALYSVAKGVLLALLVGASSTAHAVTVEVVSISGANPAAMAVGETITIDLRVVADADQVFGLGLSAHGYDEAVVDYVTGSGQAVVGMFHTLVIPPTTAVAGLPNALSNPLTESFIGSNGNRVWLFVATDLQAKTAQPGDPGLDGIVNGGDAQIRLSFEAIAPGASQIRIGSSYEGDAVVLAMGQTTQATGAVIDIVVAGVAVPSIPAMLLYGLLPTLLIGTGLVGLRYGSQVDLG